MARQPYKGLGLLVSSRFHGHTHLRHTTIGRTALDEGPGRRRDLYLTTHNTHKRQTSMPPVRFEPTIPVSKRPKTHALDRTATGIGAINHSSCNLQVIPAILVFPFAFYCSAQRHTMSHGTRSKCAVSFI
jgi:hypothetical protein